MLSMHCHPHVSAFFFFFSDPSVCIKWLMYIQKAVLAIFVATYDIGPATLSHDLSLWVVESATIHHPNNPRPTSTVPLLRDFPPPCRDYLCFKAPSTIGGHAVLWVWSMLPQHHIFPSITHLRVTSDIINASRYSIWLLRTLDQSKIACSFDSKSKHPQKPLPPYA